jgi:hypothetical protein
MLSASFLWYAGYKHSVCIDWQLHIDHAQLHMRHMRGMVQLEASYQVERIGVQQVCIGSCVYEARCLHLHGPRWIKMVCCHCRDAHR